MQIDPSKVQWDTAPPSAAGGIDPSKVQWDDAAASPSIGAQAWPYAQGAARGASPMAAAMASGAALGAGVGSLFGGVGAVPGAALGAGVGAASLTLSDLAVAGYNALAQQLGYAPKVTPSQAIQAGAEALGIGKAGAAPVTEALVGGAVGAAGGGAGVRAIAPFVQSPVARGSLNVMGEQLGMQAAAGGAGGAVPAALAEYTDVRNPLALTAAGLAAGAAVPVGGNALRAAAPLTGGVVANLAAPFVGPTNKLMAGKLAQYGDLQDIAGAMRATQDAPNLPGAPARTAAERLALAGQPNVGLTGLEASLAGANATAAAETFARQQQRVAAIQARVAQIDDALKTQATALAPADKGQLRQVRDTLMRELADEQQTLANTAQVAAQPLPTVRQQDVGEAIQTRGAERSEQLKQEYIRPGFREAFAADAPEPSIDLARPLAMAERRVGDIGAIVDPTRVSPAVRNLLRLEPVATADAAAASPLVSMEDFQSIRSALRRQSSAVRTADPVRAEGLEAVIREMDAALAASPVPQAGKDLLREARRRVSEVQVPMFRTGETGKMLSDGSYNMPKTLPSKQVEAFLKTEESAAQFVRTFESDPAALRSMQQGVLDLYRQAVVDPVTRGVDPRKAAAFEQNYARQLDTLEANGLNVRETMGQVRQDATAVQQAMETLATEAKKFGKAKSANEVVDMALKSPMDMRFVRDRLTPKARTALSDELIRRAGRLIEADDPDAALKYLTKNEKAIKVGVGKTGAKAYDELVGAARFQKELAEVAKTAPKADAMTPARINGAFKPNELADLKTVAEQLKREIALTRQMDEMATATGTKSSGANVATELAQEAGTSVKDAPAFFTPVYTAMKNTLRRVEDRMNRKTAAALADLLIKNPDRFIELADAALKAKPSRLVPAQMSAGAFAASQAANVPNLMAPQDSQNAMSR